MSSLRWLSGLSVLAIALGAGNARAADEKKDDDQHAAHFQACAKECAECMRECQSCARHCADMIVEGKKDHMTALGHCVDCADFCAAAAKIVARRGPLAAAICESCAKACDACAGECEKFPDDEHMKRCAHECRTCAKACRAMLENSRTNK